MASILLVTNSAAGSAEAADLRSATAVLGRAGPVEVARLERPDDLSRALDRRAGRLLVVAGGDGTLHAVIGTLHHRGELSRVVLGLIPLGTGNDFARGAGIGVDVEEAARVVVAGRVRPVDLIVDDRDDVVVNNVHLGVGAEASRRGALWKERLGRAGYAIGLLQAAFHPAFRLELLIDGEPVTAGRQAILEVSVGNGASVGGGLPLNPGAHPGDGALDVIVSFASGRLRRITYGIDLFRATHPERGDVLHRRAQEVRVGGEPFYTCADGEIAGPVTGRSWRLVRSALQMIMPESGREAVS